MAFINELWIGLGDPFSIFLIPKISIGDCIQPTTSTSDTDLEDQETPCWQINASGGCKKCGIVSG
jgi:hypothetical protein